MPRKSEDSTGVMTMLDMLTADLDKEMTEAETTEKDAQADHETAMKDAADKRTANSKLLTEPQRVAVGHRSGMPPPLEPCRDRALCRSHTGMSPLTDLQVTTAMCHPTTA